MILSISIAVIICIGLPVSGLIITSKQLSRREADYQLLRKHYTDKFFRLEELEELHDSMTRARDLWEDKYRKLKVDYKELREKHDSVVKDFDDYHRRVMDEESRQHDSKLLDEISLEVEQRFIEELNNRMPIIQLPNNGED
tara:strand:+ start:731 stop:1153 length:423 start_codon:yes stop_codon:yes gene_type:complete